MEKLINQIKEDYGKATYTYTAYHKMADKNIRLFHLIKIAQISLTAISATGFIATIITNLIVLSWVGGITAVLSLFLTLVAKDFKLIDDAATYKKAADELWLVRQKYISLLVDCDVLDLDEIRATRDQLQSQINSVNKRYPGTTNYGYKKARKALKENDEQFFSEEELDLMLPKELRKIK